MLYSIFYFLMYFSSFIAMQYLNLYYKQIGLSSISISKIIIASSIIAIFSSMIFGYKFDRTLKKHYILYTLLIFSCVFFCSIVFLKSFILILIFNVLFSIFYFSLQPLFTTVTLSNIEKNCQNYGTVRLFGTIGFCVASILIPLIKYEYTIFVSMFIVTILMLIVFTIILKKDQINIPQKKFEKFKIKELFSSRVIIIFILFVSIINITHGAYFNFFGIYFTENLGYSRKIFGILCAVSTLSEIPFLLLSGKIFEKYNIKSTLIISGLVTGIRWLLCMFFTNVFILVLIQVLHGVGFIVLMTSVSVYINNNCEKKYLASTQSLFFISTLVFSRVFGCLVGGVLPEFIGQKNVFLVNVVICFLATFLLKVIVKKENVCNTCK